MIDVASFENNYFLRDSGVVYCPSESQIELYIASKMILVEKFCVGVIVNPAEKRKYKERFVERLKEAMGRMGDYSGYIQTTHDYIQWGGGITSSARRLYIIDSTCIPCSICGMSYNLLYVTNPALMEAENPEVFMAMYSSLNGGSTGKLIYNYAQDAVVKNTAYVDELGTH